MIFHLNRILKLLNFYMDFSRKNINTSNPFHKIFILIAFLALVWFLWEQRDINDFFTPNIS